MNELITAINSHPFLTILLAVLLLAQALFIFFDARRVGSKYYWLWGLFGLLNVPSSLIIYLIVTRVIKAKT